MFIGIGIGVVQTQAGGAAPAPPGPLWSALATGAIADPAAWSVVGSSIAIVGGKMVFTAAGNTSTMTLAGAYATALQALLAPTTNYTVEYVVSAWTAGANGRVILGNSSVFVCFTMTGPGTYSNAITTGSNAAVFLRVAGVSIDVCTYTLDDIRIYS